MDEDAMKARHKLLGIALILPASLGLGLSANAPAYAIPDCAAGNHWVTSGESGYCAPDQFAPDTTTPEPVVTPAPSASPSAKPTETPIVTPTTAPTPSQTATPTPSVVAPTATGTPVPSLTPTTAASVEPEAPAKEENPGGGVIPNVPLPPKQGQNAPDMTSPADSIPDSSTDSVPSEEKSDETTQAVVAGEDYTKKAWALTVAGVLLLLIAAILVYSVQRFGSPFKRQH